MTGSIQLTEGPRGLRKKKIKRGGRSELSRTERIAKGVRARKIAARETVSDEEGIFESAEEEVEEESEEEESIATDPEAAESLTRSEAEEECKEEKVKEECDAELPDWDPLDLVEQFDVEQLYEQESPQVAGSPAPVQDKKVKKKIVKKRKSKRKEERTGAIKDKKVPKIAQARPKVKFPTAKAVARSSSSSSSSILTGSALAKFEEAQRKIDETRKTGDRFARFQARQLRVKALLSRVRGSVRESIADTLSSNCSTCKARKDKATAAAVKFANKFLKRKKAQQGTSSSSTGKK